MSQQLKPHKVEKTFSGISYNCGAVTVSLDSDDESATIDTGDGNVIEATDQDLVDLYTILKEHFKCAA